MRYSYEYKRKCVEMYREGRWPETPTGIKEPGNFHCMIRRWVREEEANGPKILKHTETNKVWTPEEKYELVAKVVAGAPFLLRIIHPYHTSQFPSTDNPAERHDYIAKKTQRGRFGACQSQKVARPSCLSG